MFDRAHEAPTRVSFPTKLTTIVGLVLAMFAGLVVTATAASAHHAELSASANCADGRHVVSFTARSWKQYKPLQDGEAWRALNPKIEILWQLPGGSKTVGATGAFTATSLDSNSVPLFTGQITLPDTEATTVQLQTHAISGWGPNPANGSVVGGGEWWPGSNDWITVNLKNNCQAPKPGYTINECAQGGIGVTLTNAGGSAPASFKVNNLASVTVQPGASVVVVVAATENETVPVKITANGAVLFNQNVLRDCLHPQPSVGVADTCVAGGIAIPLTNGGTEAAVFTVNGAAVTVQPGQTTSHFVRAAENETVHIKVVSGGQTLLDNDLTKDCLHPIPSIGAVNTCATNGIAIALINSGADTAVFTVNGTDVTVLAGDTETHVVTAAENVPVHVTITSGGQTLLDTNLTKDCLKAEPSVKVGEECATGGVNLRLRNTDGEDVAEFTVAYGTVAEKVSVAAGATETYTVPVSEDGSVEVKVTAPGMDDVVKTLERDCQKPTVVVDDMCGAGGIAVALGNQDGVEATFFTLTYGDVTRTVRVPKGETEIKTIPADENQTVHVTVTSGGATLMDKDLKRDCLKPEPIVKVGEECATGGVNLRLRNEHGEDVAEFTVAHGDVTETVSVPAGETETYTVPVAEGGSVEVKVTAPGMDDVVKTLERDCQKPTVGVDDMCAEDGIALALGNEDGVEATFFTLTYGDVTRTVRVPKGETEIKTVPADENQTVHVTVTSGGATLMDKNLKRDCLKPEPVVQVEEKCADGGVAIALNNTDGEDVAEFTVAYGDVTETVSVPAGETVPYTAPVAENGSVEVTVTSPGMDDFSKTLERDCQKPVVTVAEPCVEGQVALLLSNQDGDEAAEFVVSYGDVSETVTVDPGETATHTLEIAEGVTQEVEVSSGGVVVFADEITADCEDPTPPTTPTTVENPTPDSPQKAVRPPRSRAHRSGSNLASTGASTLTLIVVAAGLLTAGGLLLGGTRRRTKG